MSLKSELALRKKALIDPVFPSEEIIEEFLRQPKEVPKLELSWRQPNMVKFVRQVGPLLQWPEIYCFQKFFPVLTRWQVLNASRLQLISSSVPYVTPKQIVKKRVVKGIPSLELLWQDEKGFFNGLIPDAQLKNFEYDNPKGISDLWTTVEPYNMMQQAYPDVVEAFLKSKEKPKKTSKKQKKAKKGTLNEDQCLGSLENLDDIMKATSEIAKTVKPKRQARTKSTVSKEGLQMIDKFFKQKHNENMNTPSSKANKRDQCSTPLTKNIPSDLESDDDGNVFDMSDIVNAIVGKHHDNFALTSLKGHQLRYESMPEDISILLNDLDASLTEEHHNISKCMDDLDVLAEKRSLSNSFRKTTYVEAKRMSLDDSFDVLVKMGSNKLNKLKESIGSSENVLDISSKPLNIVDRFKQKQRISLNFNTSSAAAASAEDVNGVSYFFNSSFQNENEDIFEKLMETSLAKYATNESDVEDGDDDGDDDVDEDGLVLLSD